MVYIPNFIKIGASIKKLIEGILKAQTAWWSHKPVFIFNLRSLLDLCNHHAAYVPLNPPLLTVECPNRIFKKTWCVHHGTWAHLRGVLHKSLQSICVSIYASLQSLLGKGSVKYIPPFFARQRIGKYVPAKMNTRNNRRIVGHVCLWVCLCILPSLLGNSSAYTFPRQRIIVGGVVFKPVRVVSKESRRLVLPRISCFEIRNGGKSKVVPVLNIISTGTWRHMGEWRYSSSFLDVGTRWRPMVSFTPLPPNW
jgi:hypothetical protein